MVYLCSSKNLVGIIAGFILDFRKGEEEGGDERFTQTKLWQTAFSRA